MLTQQKANELLEYRGGDLYWKVDRSSSVKAGDKAGGINQKGYKRLKIDGVTYQFHRVVFLMHYDFMPETVDHINMDKLDNRIENLRPASVSENSKNRIGNRGMSGVKGVSWHKKARKWIANITVNNIKKHLGYFDDVELAALVTEEARNKYHGEFARHN